MSYILDALKKADAQRERDPARGIHAQPTALPTLQQPGIGQRPSFWAAAALAIAALAAAAWFVSPDAADERPAMAASDARVPRSAEAPAPPGTPPAPTGTAAPAPAPVADAVLPPPAAVAPAVVAAAQPGAATTPAENAARRVSAAKAPPASGTPASAAAAAAPPPAPPAPPAAGAAAPVPPPAPATAGEPPIGNGLPADAPRLAISGGVYSANRAQRMLIVNGQVVNEGADLGGGMVLEEIRPKAAVLRFRGSRYNVGF